MKNFMKSISLFSLLALISCFKQNGDLDKNLKEPTDLTEKKLDKKTVLTSVENDQEDIGSNNEFISNKLFKKWEGKYFLKLEDQIDAFGRDSQSCSELILIKPDSCIFKSWLTDSDGKRYMANDNYQEYLGGILATQNKDSIEFYTKKVISGGNNSLSPLLSLKQNGRLYFIYSLIVSPPNNGIIPMAIEKK